MTFDSSSPDLSPSPGVGTYFHFAPPAGLTLTIGNLSLQNAQIVPSFIVSILNGDPPFSSDSCGPAAGRYCLSAAANFQQAIISGTPYPPLGAPVGDPSTIGVARHLFLVLEGPATSLTTDALPLGFDLTTFDSAQIRFRAGDTSRLGPISEGHFNITSLERIDPGTPIPEPASLTLCGIGAAYLLAKTRRKRPRRTVMLPTPWRG